jgi:hypothetical protein
MLRDLEGDLHRVRDDRRRRAAELQRVVDTESLTGPADPVLGARYVRLIYSCTRPYEDAPRWPEDEVIPRFILRRFPPKTWPRDRRGAFFPGE